MQSTIRPFATAGAAMAAASAIALTPVAPSLPDIQVPAISSAGVQLTASPIDMVVDPWVEVFNTSSANATAIWQVFNEAPAPVLQQSIVNQLGYLNTILNDPAAISEVFETINTNLQTVGRNLTLLGEFANRNDLREQIRFSNDATHTTIGELLPVVLPMIMPDLDAQTLETIGTALKLLQSPLSGVLIGFAGPAISPMVALLNSMQAMADQIGTDPEQALATLVALPAAVTGAFLNGATLDLGFALPLLADSMPEGMTVDRLDIAFGGLLTPGNTWTGVDGNVRTPGIGGSIWNSIGLKALIMDMEGVPVGPIGATVKLSQIIAASLGWDGSGNPLTEAELPQIEEPAAPPMTPPAAAMVTGLTSSVNAPAAKAVAGTAEKTAVIDTETKVSGDETTEAPADTLVETTEAAETETTTTTDEGGDASVGTVVRNSPMAKPGQTSIAPKKAAGELKQSVGSVGKHLNSTAKKISDGFKNGFGKAKPAKKSDKGAGSAGAGSGAADSGSGASGAGDNAA